MSSQAAPGTPDIETWLRQEGERILRLALFLAGNRDLAEDIAQEAVVKMVKAWPDDRKRGMILTSPAYVRRIVINTYLDYIKAARSRTGRGEVEYDDELDYSSTRSMTGTTGDHDLRLVIQHQLDNDEREMIFACYYQDLSIEEACRQLGYPPAQAYRLHKKALATLAGQLHEEEEEEA